MKYVKYVITILICFLVTNVYAATSNFEPTINMEPDITENLISVIVGYKGENIMAITHTIAYERDYLSLIDVTTLDNFTVTKGNEEQEGNFQTLKILADSDYAFEDTNYAVLTFELKDKFKVGKSSKIFMYTYEAIGPDKDKYRSTGYEMTLRRDAAGEMAFLLKAIDSSTKREYWLSQNYLIIIAVFLVIGGIVATIFLIPSKRKKEKRAEKIRENLSGDNKKGEKDVNPIKIDYEMIEDLGTIKKEVDMSQAIEVSDLKPFGEAEGKYTENKDTNEPLVNKEETLNPMNQMNPISAIPNQVVEEKIQKEEEKPQIDAFSMKIDNNIKEDTVTNDDSVQELQEIPEEKKEDLVLFQPSFIEENNDSENNTPNVMSFVLLLIISSSILLPNVKAIEYQVDNLRNYIVGNIPYDADLDYNEDGIVDIADIIETKDLSNITLEENKPSYNFKPVESEGVHITTSTTTTTTEKNASFNINTTTTTGNKGTTTKTTTTKKTTTAKTTTVKTTTAKTTTTKTTAATYTVTISNNYSTVDNKSASVTSGKSATFKVTPNTGYTFDSVSCTNGASATYAKSSYTLTVKSVKANTTCTVNFKERDDMKVTVSATNGKVSPSSIKGSYKASGSSQVTPSTGYQYKSHSCTNGLVATYDESSYTLTVKSLTDDGSCKVVFEEKTYTMTVVASSVEKKFTAKYNASTDYTIEVNKEFTKLKCNGLTKNFTKTATSSGYKYVFTYTMTKDTVCEYS